MGALYKRRKRGPNGKMRELPTWWMKYHVNGRPVRESTGTTKVTVARRMLRDREGCVERGFPINPKQNRVTFEEAAENMLNDYRANGKRSVGEVERRIRLHLGPSLTGGDWQESRLTNYGRSWEHVRRPDRRTARLTVSCPRCGGCSLWRFRTVN